MGDQLVINDYGMFRADAWDELKKEREKRIAERKKQASFDAYTKKQMVAEFMHKQRMIGKMDSSQTDFVARQLLYVMQQIKVAVYPGDILEQAFPVNTMGGAGVNSIAYQELDFTGEFRLLAGSATDLPEIASNLSETPKKVGFYGAYIGWSLQELEHAAYARVNLQSRKQMAAGMAAKKTKNSIAWTGDPNGGGINGLFSYALNNASLTGSWSSASDCLTDILKLIDTPVADTEDFEADTLVLDSAFTYPYMNKPRSANVDTSVGRYILENTSVRSILKTSYLNSVTSATNSLSASKVCLAYPRNPMIVEFMLPRDVQQLPIQQHMLNYVVPIVMNTAGTFLYKGGANGPVAYGVPS